MTSLKRLNFAIIGARGDSEAKKLSTRNKTGDRSTNIKTVIRGKTDSDLKTEARIENVQSTNRLTLDGGIKRAGGVCWSVGHFGAVHEKTRVEGR